MELKILNTKYRYPLATIRWQNKTPTDGCQQILGYRKYRHSLNLKFNH